MNSTNFNQTGGFPLKTERLQELQTTFQILNAFGALAGNLTIISGCETVGATVQNGFVYINSELLEFRAGSVDEDSKVIIIEEAVNRAFENGLVKQVHTIRYATFGTAETFWNWSEFIRPLETKSLGTRIDLIEKKLAIFQPGGVVFPWFKPAADIPSGFQEVEDIRGRTIIGYDPAQVEFNAVGKKAGEKAVTLSKENIPPLDLTLPVSASENSGGDNRWINTTDLEFVGNKTYSDVVNKGNLASAVKTLPPYKIALYIEFIG